ncbi:hypothetical protein [Leifsonia aquatica]|uniref:hypothetical protein n=1 Tax=Leifsonia aquatica TaxID=144185 RepID=UPI0038099A0D
MEVIIWVAVVVALAALCWWAVSSFVWRRETHSRVDALHAAHPAALITSAQVAAVTHRALKRIAKADGGAFRRTGPYYSVVVVPGSLRLVARGATPLTVAEFNSEDVRDGSIGKTSWVFADYTTLFLGIRAGETTFDLPIRINGPLETSLFPASEKWAIDRWAQIETALRG